MFGHCHYNVPPSKWSNLFLQRRGTSTLLQDCLQQAAPECNRQTVATCLMADRRLYSGSVARYLSGTSPPSPVLLLPPSLFIATASVVCVSYDMLPKLIAPTHTHNYSSLQATTTRCEAKPDCSPPGYPPRCLLIIVNCWGNWFACVQCNTCTSCRIPSHTNIRKMYERYQGGQCPFSRYKATNSENFMKIRHGLSKITGFKQTVKTGSSFGS